MNALCYKIVFSKRLGTLVAVGEHTSGQGKAASGTGTRCIATNHGVAVALKTSTLAIALSWLAHSAYAAGPATSALPTGASVNSGNVAISTQGAAMTIQQSSAKASVNWNSFNIGSAASVNINQTNANAVLLNRVTGNDPSQIFGKLSANGQVVLINPNGVVFGQGGSVTASAFTASTFGLSDDDFAKGKYNYTRNGSNAGVTVQNGSSLNATAPGGYVALIGARLNNEGTISTKQGSVVMAAGESVALPATLTDNVSVPLSSKVRLELAPSTLNASVNNSGAIATEGGQVLMHAAVVSDAVASISQTGSINTTGAQGGAVTLQADGGIIQAHGSIKANSTDAQRVGGDIIIGRDEATGVLAKATDVSGAKLESQGGFVETSGDYLVTKDVSVKAAEWLLDPNDIVIGNSATTGGSLTSAQITNGVSQILASDVSAALTAGTNVTIATTGSATGGNGDITVNTAISNTAAGKTLTLNAGRHVVLNNNITVSNLALNAATGSVSGTGNLTFTGSVSINSATDGTLSGTNSGSGNLTKTGAGTVSLTGANTYAGSTSVKAGTLQVTKMGSFKSSSIAIDAGAFFDANTTTTALNTSNTTVTGAGTFKKTGSATLTMTGTNSLSSMNFISTFTGLIDIREGTLQNDGTRGNLQNNQGNVNIATGATLDIRNQSVRIKGLSGAGNIVNSWPLTPAPTIEIGYGTSLTDTYVFTGIIGAKVGAANSNPFNLSKSGAGTQIIANDNLYAGTTNINAGTLQIGNGGATGTLGTGSVTLATGTNLNYVRAAKTSIANAISGDGSVNATITGTGNSLAVDKAINLTANGKLNLVSDGDVTINQTIVTANQTSSAIFIEAGKSTAAGTATGGDIKITLNGSVTAGNGLGLVTYMTGSLAGSTGLGINAGKSRYNSDEVTTNYTAAIGSTGKYAIYREAPTLTLKVNDVSKTYDGQTYSGGSINATPTSGSLINADLVSAVTANAIFAGSSQGKKDVADSGTTITASEINGKNALGYVVTYVNGSLTIAKNTTANVVLTANSDSSKVYDGTTQSVSGFSVSGLLGEDATNSASALSGISAAASGKNAGSYSSTFSGSNADLTNNYANISKINGSLTIAKNTTANVVLTANSDSSKVYDGTTQSVSGFSVTGLVGDDATNSASAVSGISAAASGKNAGTYSSTFSGSNADLTNNYANISKNNGSLTIAQTQLMLLASADTKTYDGTTSSNAAVQIAGLAAGDSANAIQSFGSKNALGTKGSTLQVNSGYVVNDGNSGNNYIVKLTDAKGTIAPRSLTPTYAEPSKKMDGNTLATVEASPSTFGLLGSDDVTIAQSATYDTPTAGTGKTVTVRNIALSGKDSGNYALKSSTTTVKGTIVAVPPIVVPPVVTPTQASSNSGKSGGGGANARIAIGDANPFQLANVPSAIEEVCSSTNLEKCHCVESPLDKDVSICYEPK